MNKRVLVTGAAGFVGSHLVPMLTKSGYKVTALVKNHSEQDKIKNPAVKVVVCDLAENNLSSFNLGQQDIVIHLAAQINATSKTPFIKNNVIATRNIVKAGKDLKVKKFILFSSAAVTSIRLDWYAQTKKDKEEIVKRSNLNYAIIRPSMIYGPGDSKNLGWLAKFIKRIPVIPIPGNGQYGRQPIYVEDICKIVLKIISKDTHNKIYEIHGKDYVTLIEMIRVILKELNQNKKIIKIPMRLISPLVLMQEKILMKPKFTGDQINSLVSGEKFKGDKWWDDFNIRPTNIKEGIHKMLR